MNIAFSASLICVGYICRSCPRYTKKWRDDRTLEQLGAFFYGAAVVVLWL